MTLTLEQACVAIVDCEHKTAPVDPTGEYFAVGTPAMRGNRIDYDQARRISHETFLAWTRRLTPQTGDLLLAREAPVGPVVLIPDSLRVAPGQRTVLLRPDPQKLDSVFVFYLLSSPVEQRRLLEKAEGSTVPHLNVADVRRFELPPLPPLEEQRGIAATLGALDDKIESNRRAIDVALGLLDAIAQREGESLPPVPLSELASINRATVHPAALGDEVVDHFSLPAFDANARPDVVAAASIMSNKTHVTGRSILVSRLNPRTNRTWWVSPRPGVPACASTEFACLTATNDPLLAGLWLAVRYPYFREELTRRVTGTSGSHQRVRPEDLLVIDVPDVREMPDGVKREALALLAMVDHRREESAALVSLRHALLPELLAGRIRAPDASVPLAK